MDNDINSADNDDKLHFNLFNTSTNKFDKRIRYIIYKS